MNKKLVTPIIVGIVVIALVIGGFVAFKGGNKSKVVAQPQPQSTTNTVTKVNQEAVAVEKVIDDSTKNNKITKDEMLKIGKDKYNQFTTIYTLKNDDELNKYLSDTYLDTKKYEEAAKKVYDPKQPSAKVENTFENESVELLGETGMKYKATITTKITETDGKVNQYKNQIQIDLNKDQKDNQYKIIGFDSK
jgi:hypothetical protein